MNENQILIQANSATPNSESFALSQSLTCEIRTGSLVCIIGQRINILNDHMEMLAGLNTPYAGSVSFLDGLTYKNCNHCNGKNINCLSVRYIYRNSALMSILNGINNVKAPALYHHRASVDQIDLKANKLLSELEYGADHELLPAFMSTLQKKHLLIVRAIMLKPKVLFIESPFMDLDREQVRIFGQYLAGLVKDKNITVIASNVNLDFVQSYADQIIYLTPADIHIFKEKDAFSSFFQVTSS